jgi:hypothetical protein
MDRAAGGVPSAAEVADSRVDSGQSALAKKKAAPAKTTPPAAKDAENAPADKYLRHDDATQATLARRADELFAAGRWSEAVAAYRELLRRFPHADHEARWRARVSQAQALADRDAPAAAAKAGKAAVKNAAPATEAAPASGE